MKALEMLNKSFMKASLYYKSFIKALQKSYKSFIMKAL